MYKKKNEISTNVGGNVFQRVPLWRTRQKGRELQGKCGRKGIASDGPEGG